jgi:class 3 adenylate cyclase/putative methionine-R-sulfoxide reductase with GAF domain
MLREGVPIGVLGFARSDVRPFTDKQIELVSTFADQAVIAIENVRLFEAEQARTRELRESLEQQTATSDVLRVISSSPGELEPVFETILENATRICEANFGNLLLYDGTAFQVVAMHGAPQEYREARRRDPMIRPQPGASLDHLVRTKQVFHSADIRQQGADSEIVLALAGARTFLSVPMLKDNELIGAIGIYRQEVRPFTDKQIALLTNFADQAVIAIENTRLLNELRESLQQQTATADVLRIISSSPGELEPVFRAMLENATRICEAKFGLLNLHETSDSSRVVAMHNVPEALAELRQREPVARFGPSHPLARVAATKSMLHIADLKTDAARGGDASTIKFVQLTGSRTMLVVPMLKDEDMVGAISVYREEVRPFTDKQISLLQNFAAQAVIAIENTRLLNELRQRTDELNTLNQELEQRVADQVGEIERMGRLRRFLPPQVADLIVSSGTEKQLESHRREITALFCDLRGFTGFSESADPEDVMALLREYHTAIGKIIYKHGGTLERFAGDGVMVIFNDPVPLPNPALVAVMMALEMRSAIGALVERWRRLGHELGFGIGISHGYATLGTIGFEGRFDYAAIGTVSNVASRLCDEAKPGQILISPRVLLAVENAVTVQPAGELTLKGIRRPIAVYNVIDAVAPQS